MSRHVGLRTFFFGLAAVATVGVATVGVASAQQTIVTDRPSFTDSSLPLDQGAVQIETGFAITDQGRFEVFSLPEMQVRIGLRGALELKFGVPDYVDTEYADGFGDAWVGAKLKIKEFLDGWDMSAVGRVVLPTGADGISGETIGVQAALVGSTALNDEWTLGAQASLGLLGDGNENNLELGASGILGTALSESLGTFVEMGMWIPEHGGVRLVAHGGLVYLVQDNIQVDVHLGLGLTDESPDSVLGAGFSIGL